MESRHSQPHPKMRRRESERAMSIYRAVSEKEGKEGTWTYLSKEYTHQYTLLLISSFGRDIATVLDGS